MSFLAWVYKIAKNLLLDTLKRRSMGQLPFAQGEDQGGPRVSGVVAGGRGVSSAFALNEEVEQMLGHLKAEEETIVRMRLRGKEFKEIAGELGKKEDAVRRAYSRAIDRLRERAAGNGDKRGNC